MNGEKIEDYLMNLDELKNYDDAKFNKCKSCKNKNDNAFFCEKCKKNLCGDCSYKCKKFDHELIDLKKMQNDLITQRNGIVDIMKKRFKDIEDPKAEKTPNIQKLNNSSIKENKIEIKKAIDTHKRLNDISLIARITKKLYINYFHIKNVFHCYGYVVNRYSETFNKRCIQIIYDIQNCEFEEDIQILGDSFVEKNKDKLDIIINNTKYNLIGKTKKKDIYLEVILIQKDENEYLKDMSCMFFDCKYIKEFNQFIDNKIIDFTHVKNISYMFKYCSNIKVLNVSLFNFTKIQNMVQLFYGCESLIEINGLNCWNTKNVTSMADMFNSCKKLTKINLESFDTNNVTVFKKMFNNCSSLKSLLGIDNWIMKKAQSLEGMFKGCKVLEQLPDISKWELKEATSMKKMFSGCEALKSLPDISKWNVKKVTTMKKMFFLCESLSSLPDFFKWDLESIKDLRKIFDGCKVSQNTRKWNFQNHNDKAKIKF